LRIGSLRYDGDRTMSTQNMTDNSLVFRTEPRRKVDEKKLKIKLLSTENKAQVLFTVMKLQ